MIQFQQTANSFRFQQAKWLTFDINFSRELKLETIFKMSLFATDVDSNEDALSLRSLRHTSLSKNSELFTPMLRPKKSATVKKQLIDRSQQIM